MAGLKLHQHVHVAFGREIIPQNRPEKCQSADMVTTTKISKFLFRYFNSYFHACTSANIRALYNGSSALALVLRMVIEVDSTT